MSVARILSRSIMIHLSYSLRERVASISQPSVVMMDMACARWWRSITLPSLEYRAARFVSVCWMKLVLYF